MLETQKILFWWSTPPKPAPMSPTLMIPTRRSLTSAISCSSRDSLPANHTTHGHERPGIIRFEG